MNPSNLALWFEIPAIDLDRACRFYEAVFGIALKAEPFGPDVRMAVFNVAGADVKGALVHGPMYRPGADGPLVYLNGGADLAVPLGRVEAAGGQVIVGKTEICAEHGFFAVFGDSEGNRLALHSMG